MVTEARRWRKDVAAHAYGGEGARAAVLGGARSIEHGMLLDESILNLMVGRLPCDEPHAENRATGRRMTDSTCIDQRGEERGSMPAAVDPSASGVSVKRTIASALAPHSPL